MILGVDTEGHIRRAGAGIDEGWHIAGGPRPEQIAGSSVYFAIHAPSAPWKPSGSGLPCEGHAVEVAFVLVAEDQAEAVVIIGRETGVVGEIHRGEGIVNQHRRISRLRIAGAVRVNVAQ